MKFLKNPAIYAVLYILLMLPTYYLPYMGSNSAILGGLGQAADAGINPAFWPHLLALIALIALTWFRGSLIDKKWLVIFPILATLFDLAPALSMIPFVPTVMHLFAIILGVSSKNVENVTQQTKE